MKRDRFGAWALIASIAWPPGPLHAVAAEATEPEIIDQMIELYRTRHFFALRERLQEIGREPSAEILFLGAAVDNAFNRPQDSNAALASLAADDLRPELAAETRRLRMSNHLRLHDYRGALTAAREILASPEDHPPRLVSDVRNTSVLLRVLQDVPAQEVEVSKTVQLSLDLDGLVPVAIGAHRTRLGIDTGANFSVLMRSEATRAGLTIHEIGLLVGTSTGREVKADLAVAPAIRTGTATFRNVVFLVFPDELLSFTGGRSIPGFVGFPMLEAVGEVRFGRRTLEIPAKIPRRKNSNLALDDSEPLVRARWLKWDILCRLDTGANRTFFYAPFFERFKERIYKISDPQEVDVRGVGGLRTLDVYRAPVLTLNVARADVRLRRVDIYSEPLVEGVAETIDCNIGRDLFRDFRFYAINFRDMAFVLGPYIGR